MVEPILIVVIAAAVVVLALAIAFICLARRYCRILQRIEQVPPGIPMPFSSGGRDDELRLLEVQVRMLHVDDTADQVYLRCTSLVRFQPATTPIDYVPGGLSAARGLPGGSWMTQMAWDEDDITGQSIARFDCESRYVQI